MRAAAPDGVVLLKKEGVVMADRLVTTTVMTAPNVRYGPVRADRTAFFYEAIFNNDQVGFADS